MPNLIAVDQTVRAYRSAENGTLMSRVLRSLEADTDRPGTVYFLLTVRGSISCCRFRLKNAHFYFVLRPVFNNTPVKGVITLGVFTGVSVQTCNSTRMMAQLDGVKSLMISNRVDTVAALDRQTDRQTDRGRTCINIARQMTHDIAIEGRL